MGAVLFFAKIFRIIILLRGKTMKLGVVGIIIERDRSVFVGDDGKIAAEPKRYKQF